MARYLCVDGGGSKARILAFDSRGAVLADAVSDGGVNANFMPAEVACAAMLGGIGRCLDTAGLAAGDISRVGIFSPGVKPYEDKLCQALLPAETLVLSDRYNAFWGSLGGPPGLVVLSGTGSFAFGIDSRGKEIMAGGWGSVFGDHGSGYHIGVLCLKTVTQQHDSGLAPGGLARAVLAHTGFEDVEELRLGLNRPGVGRKEIAALCLAVEKAALSGDADAREVIDEAAAALAFQARQVWLRHGSPRWKYTLTGGVANMGGLILAPLADHMARQCPGLEYMPPRYPPHVGGMLYMLHTAGEDISSPNLLKNIDDYLAEVK